MTRPALGARVDGDGIEFGVFSSVAESVELCLFDDAGAESRRPREADEGFVWRGRVAGAGAGMRYGFRVHGPWDPASGERCNPAKLLLDPYARAIAGSVHWHQAVQGEDPGDSAPYVPRSVVCASEFDWDERPSARDGAAGLDHVRAARQGLHEAAPEGPGASAGHLPGLAEPAVTAHLQRLGVTAVELLPVHQFVHDRPLVARGLHNYWGYQSIGYFAPHNEYSSAGDGGQQIDDFKAMVRGLHAAPW